MIDSSLTLTVLKTVRLLIELTVARLLGVKVVWTVHDRLSHKQPYPRWESLWRRVVAQHFCDDLIVHCDTARDIIRETYSIGSKTPIEVIPHGHYIGRYPDLSKDSARDDLGIDDDRTVFTFFGRIREYKQIPELIEVFTQLDEERAMLLIAGKPSSDTLRRSINKRAKGNNVRTELKFIPEKEVAKYFKASDIIVLHYRDILTSGSAILAMSMRRPVITPALGCLPELIEDGTDGLLYDSVEPSGLRNAMKRALEVDLDRLGGNGYDKIAKLDWSIIAQSTIQVYDR
ncbi:glycosyltransferase family 4 protein [Haloarcula sp. S1CR25-12]|uniref:Glycosyltransferase family 4 protein n=1 Tax=Haloarcula saliterrae TaxID=2950534 RepID=A0ABU2FCW2_9EURY|nr:glycosyltransferase family 4 protein [Haloarcula sp. S1CR25-12]